VWGPSTGCDGEGEREGGMDPPAPHLPDTRTGRQSVMDSVHEKRKRRGSDVWKNALVDVAPQGNDRSDTSTQELSTDQRRAGCQL
jgi:hypothetical protein